jgi:hypothetical protein
VTTLFGREFIYNYPSLFRWSQKEDAVIGKNYPPTDIPSTLWPLYPLLKDRISMAIVIIKEGLEDDREGMMPMSLIAFFGRLRKSTDFV